MSQLTRMLLVITNCCAGLAAAIPAVYPRARRQRCWVNNMRNLFETVRRSDRHEVKRDTHRIYQAGNLSAARRTFQRFHFRWRAKYSTLAPSLERDLPSLLTFFDIPKHL